MISQRSPSSNNSNLSRTQETIGTKSFIVGSAQGKNQFDENKTKTKTKNTNIDTENQSQQSSPNIDPEEKLIDDE